MKMFCKDLKDQAMKIINYKKKEMTPLIDEEKEAHENQKTCYICKKEFCIDENDKKEFKNLQKVRDHCHYTGNIEMLPIVIVIKIIKYQNRSLYFFIMDLHTTIIS